MVELACTDQAALDQFTTEVVAAGFEPVPGSERRRWQGPIRASLAQLTTATTMRLELRDGWPFRHPYLEVDGLDVEHVNDGGVVCLWMEGDNSRAWLTYAGIVERIDQWCQQAQTGFRAVDHALDAYIGFAATGQGIATFDLDQLTSGPAQPGQSGRLHATQRHDTLIELAPGVAQPGSLRGQWFQIGSLAPPPRNLDEIQRRLTTAQRRDLDKSLRRVTHTAEPEIAVVVGERHGTQDSLVLRILPNGIGTPTVDSIEPAPTDRNTLRLRSGPDAEKLESKRVVFFGAGAIGSHLALLLAESGVGQLHLLDRELLRPGNAVRHIAGRPADGQPKVSAVADVIGQHAPWTAVTATQDAPWDHNNIATLITGADLTIDATGVESFLELLSRIAERQRRPLLTAALYRAGAIGRTRRQLPDRDPAIYIRAHDTRYPIIPAGPDGDPPQLEMGCSAPVNNAPPATVAAISAVAAQVAIDALTGRIQHPDEVIDVYRPLSQPPFDRIGRVPHP